MIRPIPTGRTPATRWQLVIFDFDGTLADTYPWFVAELASVAARWRLRPLAAGEDAALRRLDATAIFRELGVPRWKLPLIAADLRLRMTRDIDRIRLFDGVPAMLTALAGAPVDAGGEGAGLSSAADDGGAGRSPPAAAPLLALASSNSLGNCRRVLGAGLWELFAASECGAPLAGKAARLTRLLRRLRVAPHAAIYIGDELRDLTAARQAGIACGLVCWGYNDPDVLRARAPDLLFGRVAEIASRLRGQA